MSERPGASTASPGEHLTFCPNIPQIYLMHPQNPPKNSHRPSPTSEKLSAIPGSPIHTTDTITSTWPTNFGLATTRTKRGHTRGLDAFTGSASSSFLANNPNLESNLDTPLNLHHAVRDGSLKAGTNIFPRTKMSNASDADRGGTWTPKRRGFHLNTSSSGSLPSMRSVS